ncbi:hypothetical protein WKK_06620 [Weissella koreensis KACC 15510]|uniref:hypothetical protein n=1 Tax=Weissella koreensis TaxID=165096 RepID=UPI0002175C04|nr:hypothetical protein [Weissella koreensis]AEJ24194.1 hypothetical protein WKK_06620 [Weissella koreensis KACC 15510]
MKMDKLENKSTIELNKLGEDRRSRGNNKRQKSILSIVMAYAMVLIVIIGLIRTILLIMNS